MISIEVTLLTGRYVATAHHDRGEHEWPPHPARLFSALVATWADADVPDPAERDALEWLESCKAPAIAASLPDDVAIRRPVSHFVPVNDASVIAGAQYRRRADRLEGLLDEHDTELEASHGELTRKVERVRDRIDKERDVTSLVESAGRTNPKDADALLPDGRGKQERQFPSVTPACPQVCFSWAETPVPDLASALDGLLSRVTRLGHSSSLVSCRLVETTAVPTMQPGSGSIVLRCPQRGQLMALEQEHRRHEGIRPRSLPFVGVRYSTVAADNGSSTALRADTAGDFLVFELPDDKRRFPTTRTIELTEALRGAIFRHADDPLPEGLSGHLPDGQPSLDPHAAFLALPNVGHAHADGRIMGLAVMLPEALGDEAARAAFRAIGKWEQAGSRRRCRLTLTGGITIELLRKQPPFELRTLRSHTWERPSSEWVSVTPIALPKNPGRLASGSPASRSRAWAAAEEQVRQSCLHVGLPQPAAVAVSLDPLTTGAHPAARFPAFVQGTRRASGVRRRLVHAAVRFEESVTGPVVLGSGRFMGLGLMRPLPRRAADVSESESGVEDER
ncbi:type I-G CRISPR-associated protein Csb2 [Candidatus Poriferisodalis sp.]|uniref:type I-G CRISPR-associated protein Csb2 n=1 Tax=Candidatus Poriferisodalis sp. TaxID=3101277 RepID=UPI003B523E32